MCRSSRARLRCRVAPFAGAWIEIAGGRAGPEPPPVAPFAGAWIEITSTGCERPRICVAPFAGAWIEIESLLDSMKKWPDSRSLHGSVD